MKQVVIVAPYFPPSNLAAVHRSRYFAMHLPKFGWKVKVLTVEPSFYEESLDPELEALSPNNFEIIRTKAIPTRPLRIIGDLGIRAFFWHYRTLVNLIQKERVDLVYIPIPPYYSAMLGPLVFKKYRIPYAIDYIDPWTTKWPGCEIPLSKAWFAYHLNQMCEPTALRNVSLITGVAPKYYEGVLNRYSWLKKDIFEAMPYGAEVSEYQYLDEHPRPPSLFDPSDGCLHFVYAGVMWPQAYDTLEALLTALAGLKRNESTFAGKLRFHFVGTGLNDVVKKLADQYEVSDIVSEHSARIPYLEVLNNLKSAYAPIILGSLDAHYSPSKVFQTVLSRRPVLVILHAQSTAIQTLRDANTGFIVTYDDIQPVRTKITEIQNAIHRIIEEQYLPDRVNWNKFFSYSAEAMASKLAQAFDRITR